MKRCASALFLAALLGLAFCGAHADHHLEAPVELKAVGSVSAVKAVFDVFAEIISDGGIDNGNAPGVIKGGRRSIDWDADIVPFDMPGDFFRNTRGFQLNTAGEEFRVSNPPPTDPYYPDNLFDTFNKNNPLQFQAFSPERIFSPLTDNVLVETYFVPGKDQRAVISAYGAIFVDVDLEDTTSVEFFDQWGNSLGVFYVPAAPQGLSFLGVDLGKAEIYKVVVTLGNAKLGTLDGGVYDVVVMDDFLISEPVPVKQENGLGRKVGEKPYVGK